MNALNNKIDNSKMSTSNIVVNLINSLNLQPHPEGGYFSEVFRSNDLVKSVDNTRYNNENRSAGTSIYYLLNKNDFSAWHRLKSDEIWHYYKGCDIIIHTIDQKNNFRSYLLGDPTKSLDASFQVIIPSGTWFAAELIDKLSYGLIGCTVNPGFEFKDFELANRNLLLHEYPQYKTIITEFTRVSK